MSRYCILDFMSSWPSNQYKRNVKAIKYVVIYEKGPRNYSAYVPDLPGCVAAGKTLADTERLMREAIEFHIESLREHGEEVPHPTSIAKEMQVSA